MFVYACSRSRKVRIRNALPNRLYHSKSELLVPEVPKVPKVSNSAESAGSIDDSVKQRHTATTVYSSLYNRISETTEIYI